MSFRSIAIDGPAGAGKSTLIKMLLREETPTKGVVLVEKADSTLYAEVARELELLRRQDIAILGGIIVE